MFKLFGRCTVISAATVALGFAAAASAQTPSAQTASTQPTRLLVGFSAGGPTDVIARAFAEHASRSTGRSFIVENRAGANTIIAAEAAASARPDGQTLLFAATNHTMLLALYAQRLKFDPLRSFTPICRVATSPTVLVVGASVPALDAASFVQAIGREPQRLTYASAGAGSSGHFAGEAFLQRVGARMTHIPYKGASQAITDVMGGQVDASFATLGSVLPQLASGKLRALAVAADARVADAPQVPTFDELNIAKGWRADVWWGVLAPKGTPSAALADLEKAAQSFAQDSAAQDKLRSLGLQLGASCGAPFAQQLQQEVATYQQQAQQLKLQID